MEQKKIDNYLLIEQISRSMSVLFKAKDLNLDKIVALKILPEEYVENPVLSRLFQKEFKNLAQMDHPNITRIHHAGQYKKRWYFVMEWVDGIDMKKYIVQHKGIEFTYILPIFKQIAHALHYAHQKGIVHRDIKSSNVLLKNKGNGYKAYLTDFGISKDTSSSNTSATMTRGVLGTADYIPPEQALGQRHLIGIKSDIYSLGIVLYEMLCGRVPFKASSETAVIQKHLNETPPSPRVFNPKIPLATVRVVLKAIEKDPSKRYANTGEFYQALKLSFEESIGSVEPIQQAEKINVNGKYHNQEKAHSTHLETILENSGQKWIYPAAVIVSVLFGIVMFFIGQNLQSVL